MATIQEKIDNVRSRIEAAAARSGRVGKDIRLVAVTKGADAERVRQAQAAGIELFGENRVQEAAEKVPAACGGTWHMIGHLQTNKIKTALPLFSVIQSVDSVRLAKAIDEAAADRPAPVEIYLEVNISAEPQKYGFKPDALYSALDEIAELPRVRVTGLMGISPLEGGDAARREAFKKLKGLFVVCKSIRKPNIEIKNLSMGMSEDFEAAIEEGSNMVRIGRAIFS